MRRSTVLMTKVRTVLLVLFGVAGLVLKRHYSGPHQSLVHSYGGNVAASFAVYFVVSNLYLPPRLIALGANGTGDRDQSPVSGSSYRRLLTAAAALLVVELFEITNGFGVMTNVYDRVDLVANAGGVALALVVDALTPGGLPLLPHHE